MSKKVQVHSGPCLNCGEQVQGAFCHACGQKALDNTDRSLIRLLGEFLGNVFFLDNRFFLSFRYLIAKPGTMTVAYLQGKRKKFLSPVTLFLFINLIYFLVNPLTDYSLALYDQMFSQPYSAWANQLVQQKLEEEGLSFETYAVTYQNASDNLSKSIMILNVPLIALFVYLIGLKKRKFFFDGLIYSFHLFSVFLLWWIFGYFIGFLIPSEFDVLEGIAFISFTLIIPVMYAILSVKKYLDVNWFKAILGGLGAFIGIALTQLAYRGTIFIFTFWST